MEPTRVLRGETTPCDFGQGSCAEPTRILVRDDSGNVPTRVWGQGPLNVPGHVQSPQPETRVLAPARSADLDAIASDLTAVHLQRCRASPVVGRECESALSDLAGTPLQSSPDRLALTPAVARQSRTIGSKTRQSTAESATQSKAKQSDEGADGLQSTVLQRRTPLLMRSANNKEQLIDLVFECVAADGLDLGKLPLSAKVLTFPVDLRRGRFVAILGRQHQPELFESLVRRPDRLVCISRCHIELSLDPRPGAQTMLKRLSGNPVTVNGQSMAKDVTMPVHSGANVAMSSHVLDEPPFLTFRLLLRSRDDVAREGPHAAPRVQRSLDFEAGADGARERTPPVMTCALLECSHAQGLQLASSRLRPEAWKIELPSSGDSVEVGRQHQVGFFERLLKAEPQWLPFISRSHLRLNLLPHAEDKRPSVLRLQVHNLSANVVLVSGQPLYRGQSSIVFEGGSLSFVARLRGGGTQGESGSETAFLCFTLHTAPSITAL